MSFLERAKQAASQAAEQAKVTAEQARVAATETAHRAQATMADPATGDRAKAALGRARRGLSTAIDRIDPNVLAEVVIKATALQERTNHSLRTKRSPYRISELAIGASIPPSVTFSITRLDTPEEIIADGINSTDLVTPAGGAPGEVLALDGSTIEDAPHEDDPS